MYLTDSDLLMLENLTYMNNKTRTIIPGLRDIHSYASLEEYFAVFDENALNMLEAEDEHIVNAGECSGSELAAMLRFMKGRENIKNLHLLSAPINKQGHPFALVFEDPHYPGSIIVAFHGTVDPEEWKDNALGLYQTDTKAQVEALQFIEMLPSKDLTVVGHSKGGNKAQYVSILSQKVSRGVSFDSQGFSQEFLHKYANEISKHATKIKSYSLTTDFIHPLLFKLPGVTQLYVYGGADVSDIIQHHSANSFFEYYKDEKGDTNVICTKDGNAYLPMAEESTSAKIIRNFSSFIQNTASKMDKKTIGDFLGDLIYIHMRYKKNTEKQRKALIERLFHNPKELAILLAYTLKYIEVYYLKNKDITLLLQALGLSELNQLIKSSPYGIEALLKTLGSGLTNWEK